MEISSLSLEYVAIPISARAAGVSIDPTGDTVEIAIVAAGTLPVAEDWTDAAWETDLSTVPPTYLARILIGTAGDITLTAGVYDAFVRITDTPEVPVLRVSRALTVG